MGKRNKKMIACKENVDIEVQERMGCSPREARQMVAHVLGAIETVLGKYGAVQIKGFGTFERRTRKARRYRHPETKEVGFAPAKEQVVFRVSPVLAERIASIEVVDQVAE